MFSVNEGYVDGEGGEFVEGDVLEELGKSLGVDLVEREGKSFELSCSEGVTEEGEICAEYLPEYDLQYFGN